MGCFSPLFLGDGEEASQQDHRAHSVGREGDRVVTTGLCKSTSLAMHDVINTAHVQHKDLLERRRQASGRWRSVLHALPRGGRGWAGVQAANSVLGQYSDQHAER